MKAALILVLLFLVLCALISSQLVSFSVLYDNLVMLSSTRIFRYSVFNSIIVVILASSFRLAAGEFLPLAELLRGEQEEQTQELKYASEDSNEHSDDDDSHCGSSGYEDDNDDDSSDCERGFIEDDKEIADHDLENKFEADQETEHDLENKAEAFISKVIEGWKKELLMDKLMNI